jgi:catechol 2,3-dioxygenase-like lactoylglutathione lyase family enzyme
MMPYFQITPELDVSDIKKSLAFYIDALGFKILYERSEEKFVYLDIEGAGFMLEEAAGPGRRFRTAPLEHPYGRGVNFQIFVNNIDSLYERAKNSGQVIIFPLEDRWYRQNTEEVGNRQFVVADPDGYLLRFFHDLGKRPIAKVG